MNIRIEDADRFFAVDGPLEALLGPKQTGRIKYSGFTAKKPRLFSYA